MTATTQAARVVLDTAFMNRPLSAFALLASLPLLLLAATATYAQPVGEAKANFFDDPFLQATSAIPECPVPSGPLLTEAERRAEAHYRAERGTSCFQSGRCRLPNAYLYDKEIIPRVKKAIDATGRYSASTSIWVEGQRRWVWLKGCVRRQQDSDDLERLVRGIDDVEAVINRLVVLP